MHFGFTGVQPPPYSQVVKAAEDSRQLKRYKTGADSFILCDVKQPDKNNVILGHKNSDVIPSLLKALADSFDVSLSDDGTAFVTHGRRVSNTTTEIWLEGWAPDVTISSARWLTKPYSGKPALQINALNGLLEAFESG